MDTSADVTPAQMHANQALAHWVLHESPPGVTGAMEAYLSHVCKCILSMYNYYGLSIEKEIAAGIRQRPKQGGRIAIERIHDGYLLSHGNLREKIGFILDIAMGTHEIEWRLIADRLGGKRLPGFVNPYVIDAHIERIVTLTGIPHAELLHDFVTAPFAMPSSLIKLPADGSVLFSRFPEYPFLNSARIKRPDAEVAAYAMPTVEADPPLSLEEQQYMEQAHGTPVGHVLPWFTGMCCSFNHRFSPCTDHIISIPQVPCTGRSTPTTFTVSWQSILDSS